MKNSLRSLTLALFAVFALVAFTACTTTGGTSNPDRSAAITSAMLEIAGTSFAPVLANNLDYVPVAQAVADALGVLETGEINLDTIRSFVAQVAQHHGFTPAQRAYAELVVSAAWNVYTAQTGNVTAQIGDANANAWIASFRRGLLAAITISADLKK